MQTQQQKSHKKASQVEVLRGQFLEPDEQFMLEYIDSFDRESNQEWGSGFLGSEEKL